MSAWTVLPATAFCASVRDGTHDSPKRVDVGQKLITSKHMIGDRLTLDKAYLISNEDFEGINRRSKVDQWDVLISMIGTVGEVFLVKEEPNFAIKNIGLFKSKSELHGRWLFNFLRSPRAQEEIASRLRGTTQLYIPLGELRTLPIWHPSGENEMREITSVLDALDDKIEMNRKTAATLEEMARALYRSWFVDFDPVHAKAAGRAPAHMDTKTAALFPDSFGENGLPEGWDEKRFIDVASLKNGYAFKSTDWTEEGVPVIKIKSIKDGSIDLGNASLVSDKLAKEKSAFKIDEGAAAIGLTGYVGEVGRVPPSSNGALVNQRVARIDPEDGTAFSPFVYAMSRTIEFKDYVIGKSYGSAQPNVSTKDILNYVCCAPDTLISKYNEHAGPIYAKQFSAAKESQTLTTLRDTLLPRLMSGELRVGKAKETVEAVA